jgi:hypothetical protein
LGVRCLLLCLERSRLRKQNSERSTSDVERPLKESAGEGNRTLVSFQALPNNRRVQPDTVVVVKKCHCWINQTTGRSRTVVCEVASFASGPRASVSIPLVTHDLYHVPSPGEPGRESHLRRSWPCAYWRRTNLRARPPRPSRDRLGQCLGCWVP